MWVTYNLTADIAAGLALCLADPILKEVVKNYHCDNKFLYIPVNRIDNKHFLSKMLYYGKLKRA